MISLAVLVACADPTTRDPLGPPPLDGVLTFADLQAKGTHNSYHVATSEAEVWDYTHAVLPTQADEQGVRQFELDVEWDEELGAHRVRHIPVVDEGTTCETFVLCARDLWAWSFTHPMHHPLFVLVETKDGWDPETGPEHTSALERELLSIWDREDLITPDDLRRDHPDLRTAIEQDDWPTLGELRGRALFVLHSGGERRDDYVKDLDGHVLFPDAMGDVGVPWAAVHTMNDPADPRIAEVVGLRHLVRTRADSDTREARQEDTSHRDQALASGAHFVSTDYPAPVEGTSYVVEIPGGTPSRCNPLTAPPECTSRDIEDLQ
ncbi:MAG: hypothetical protein KC621_06235 [Myxococcales bacterium]|nr:hypothetical protein [Myxococcales bacterium]